VIIKESDMKFTLCPAGTHFARCFAIVDLGTHTETFQGKVKQLRKIRISWEICGEKTEDGKPFTISKFYTRSLGEKATLQKDLQSWRGKPFTAEELKGFEMKNILGAACMLTVIHEEKADKTMRDKIASVAAVPKGSQIPDLQTPKFIFDIDEWDNAVYEKLPDWVKEKITTSPEGAKHFGYKTPPASGQNQQSGGTPGGEPVDDGIPF